MKMRKIIAIVAAVLMLCSILPFTAMAADTYELASSIKVGDTVVLVCKDKSMELNGISTTSTKYGLGVAYSSTPAGAYVLTVEAGSSAGTYAFKCPNGQYLYWSSGNSLATNASKSANSSWNVSFSNGNAIITNAKESSRKLQWNASSPRFACYSTTQAAIQLFKKVTEPESDCQHENAEYDYDCQPGYCPDCETELDALDDHNHEEEITAEPTCTEAGEKTLTCACGDVKTETVKALGHDFSEGDTCSECGAEKPLEATISFATKDQRTEYSTSKQVWENNGLTLVNDKGASTSNVGDFANPARFYKSSIITISFSGMTSLVIDATSVGTDYLWDATLTSAGLSFTVESKVYTITFAEPTDSITLTAANQVRADSITAYGSKAHEHEFNGTETKAPTCTEDGVMTYSCECGEDTYTEAIPATGHAYADAYDAYCETCGEVRVTDYEAVTSFGGTSVSEDVSGLAFKFTIKADVAIAFERISEVDYNNSFIGEFKLIGMGAVASNKGAATILGNVGDGMGNVIDIPARWLCNLVEGEASFAVRITEIPENHYDTVITARPYYVYENAEGDQITIYGEEQASSYNGNL